MNTSRVFLMFSFIVIRHTNEMTGNIPLFRLFYSTLHTLLLYCISFILISVDRYMLIWPFFPLLKLQFFYSFPTISFEKKKKNYLLKIIRIQNANGFCSNVVNVFLHPPGNCKCVNISHRKLKKSVN